MVHACFVILFHKSEIQTEHVGPIQYLSIVDLLFIDFFICSILEFLVGLGNGGAKGCSRGVLIRNALFSLKYRELFRCLGAWLYHIHKIGSFPLTEKFLMYEAKSA